MNEVLHVLRSRFPDFSLSSISHDELVRYVHILTPDQKSLLYSTIRNRDITFEGRQLLMHSEMDTSGFADLLNEHHTILRDILQISTPKIDKMLKAAMNAGAVGGKITGSGGGGCMFAYAPKDPESVAEAIQSADGTAYIVNIDSGVLYEE